MRAAADAALVDSLNEGTTAEHIPSIFVPALAGLCVIHTISPEEEYPRVAAVAGASAEESLVWDLDFRDPQNPTHADSVWEIVRSGRSLVYPPARAAFMTGAARDAERTRLFDTLQRLGGGSAMVVPLKGRERILGAVSLFTGTPAWRYTADDLRLAEELANRAAIALENAERYRRLHEAFQAREEHLAGITHDLRSPLTKIALIAELLEPCLAARDPVDEVAVEWLGRIGNTTKQMVGQIDELLTLHWAEAGCDIELERHEVDLVSLVEREVEVQRRMTRVQSIDFQTALPALVGYWDAGRLERVISNVVENAVKYTPDGGTIRITVAAVRAGMERYATLTVEDEGIGIPEQDLPHVFEPFFRATNAAMYSTGSGIGLAVSRRIVEQHAGSLTLTSTVGVGTRICLQLPLTEGPAIPHALGAA